MACAVGLSVLETIEEEGCQHNSKHTHTQRARVCVGACVCVRSGICTPAQTRRGGSSVERRGAAAEGRRRKRRRSSTWVAKRLSREQGQEG